VRSAVSKFLPDGEGRPLDEPGKCLGYLWSDHDDIQNLLRLGDFFEIDRPAAAAERRYVIPFVGSGLMSRFQ